MAELADAQDLESCGQPCRFNSCYLHQHIAADKAAICWFLIYHCGIIGFVRFLCADLNNYGDVAHPVERYVRNV